TLLPAGARFSEYAVFVDLLNESFSVHTVTLIAALWLLYSTGLSRFDKSEEQRESERERRIHARQWIIMAITTTFMATSLSIYISKLIPKIETVSFPWRWLVIATFFTSLIVAAAIDRLTIPGILTSRMSWVYRIGVTTALGLIALYTIQSVILPTR